MPKPPSLFILIKSNYELLVNENKIFLFLQKTGAAGENRTHDPALTKGVLYH